MDEITSDGRDAQLGQLVGSEPDPHAVVGAAEQIDLGDAGNSQQLVAQVDAAVVDQVVRVVRPLRGVERDDHEDARTLLLDGHALRDDLLGQPRLGRADAVLGEDVGLVLVHADREVDVQQHATVARVRRLHVDHRLDAVDFLLDRRGHRLLDGHRRGAREVRGDPDDRGRQERILLEAEPGEREDAQQHREDRDDDRDDRPPDEKLGHAYAPAFPAGFATGFTCTPGPHPLHPIHDHPLAGLEPLGHDVEVADPLVHLDGPEPDLVTALHHQHRLGALLLLHGELRHEDGVGAALDDPAYTRELSRPDQLVGVGKLGAYADGPGPCRPPRGPRRRSAPSGATACRRRERARAAPSERPADLAGRCG